MIKISIALAAVVALAHQSSFTPRLIPHETLAAWHATLHTQLFAYLHQQAAHEHQAVANVAGTWNISLQGHQVALVLEQDGRTLTGTLMIMGKDVPVDGTLSARALSLTGAGAVGDHGSQETVPLKLTATLKDDGTLEGEMSTAHGPMKWTAERLGKK
jgi:hypothetical protein